MAAMQADYLIALDHAQAELGDLYTLARRYRDLRDDADRELLAAITEVGIHLRRLRRHHDLVQDEIAATAKHMQGLAEHWRQRVDAIRTTPTYLDALAAYADNDQLALARLLPRVIAAFEVIPTPPRIYFGVRVSAPRRGPGSPHFIDSATCVDRIVERLRAGLRPPAEEAVGSDFPHLTAATDPDELDSPVSLVLHEANAAIAVFRQLDDLQTVVFTPHLAAPFVPALSRDSSDGWWEASDEPYPQFRERVVQRLRDLGYDVLDANEPGR